MKPIDVGGGYDRLSEAMEAEGVFQIRWHRRLLRYTVQLEDGGIGGGKTPREAIEDARAHTWGDAA